MFKIHLGIPEMEELWADLQKKHQDGTATKKEEKLRRQMGKAMVLLSGKPRHPGLHSHDISSLTARYGQKVWESYGEAMDETIMRYYMEKFGAFALPREHPFSICFPSEETKKIREAYDYVWTEDIS